MIRTISAATVAVLGTALAACGSSTSSTTPTPAATARAATSSVAAATSSTSAASPTPSTGTSVQVNLDPCQLVTASEASSLAATTYSAGTEQTNTDAATGGTSKQCIYGSQTLNVFEVIVAQANDTASAQAQWAAEETQVQSAVSKALPAGVSANFSLNDTSVSGADRAAVGTISTNVSGQTLSATAIYLLKGPVFAAFSDLTVGHAAPSTSAMETQAAAVVGRM